MIKLMYIVQKAWEGGAILYQLAVDLMGMQSLLVHCIMLANMSIEQLGIFTKLRGVTIFCCWARLF